MLTVCTTVTIIPENILHNFQTFVDSYENNETFSSYMLLHLDESIEIDLYSVSNEVIDNNLETTQDLLDIFSSKE